MVKIILFLLLNVCYGLIPDQINKFVSHIYSNPVSKIDLSVNENILKESMYGPIHDKLSLPLVDSIAKFLPKVDTVGHNVLLLDRYIVNNVMNNDIIPLDLKKDITLFVIKLSQEGDTIGTFILGNYYKIVDHIL